jgi:hypothetical protein
MDFYYFGGFIGDQQVQHIEDHHFAGILFTYDIRQGDFFTRVARDIDLSKKIKYMVAIRPYVISPQYLSMISQSMHDIMPNRLQINLISGHIKPHEKEVGGVLGNLNDSSSHIDKSNYLIEYIECLDKLKNSIQKTAVPDYYVSTTNQYVFDAASKLNNKMIIQYAEYNQGCWTNYENYQTNNQIVTMGEKIDVKGKDIMISIAPILRKTQEEIDSLEKSKHTTDTAYFTYDEFEARIEEIKKDGINQLMFISWPTEEREYVMDFVKQYKEKELAIL